MRIEFGVVQLINTGGASGYVSIPGTINTVSMPFTNKAGVGDHVPVVYVHDDPQQALGLTPRNRQRQLKPFASVSNYPWYQFHRDASFAQCLGHKLCGTYYVNFMREWTLEVSS